ncbi:MAG: sulfatase-like hydrolase/transferase [Gemmatimonadales bacterium]
MNRHRAILIFLTVIWFALIAGLGEAGVLLVRRFVFNHFTWSSAHAVWMAPVANVAFLLIPGLLLSAVAAARPGWIPLPVVAAVMALFTSAALLLVSTNGAMATWAIGPLALGVSIQVARRLITSEEGFVRLVRRTTPALAACVALLAVAMPGWMALRERTAIDRLEAGPGPNVLLIILDTVRAASMSLYGYERPTTPNLDRWAAGGTVFEEALAPAPWTLPSHGTMFTGHWPHELSARWQIPLDDSYPTLAEVLRGEGYVTAGFVANHYYTTRESGLSRGFLHYDDLPITAVQVLRSSLLGQVVEGMAFHGRYEYDPERTTHRRTATEIRRAFLEWFPRAEGKPWFVFLNFFDAHKPYWTHEPFASRLTSSSQDVDLYDQSILYLDHEIGLLLRELKRRGELENTLVIVTSDHGEQFGQHGMFGHGNGLYRRVLRVPLVVGLPGRVPGGERVTQAVSLRDLAPTIFELAGIADSTIPGVSLTATWGNGGSYPDTVFSEMEEKLDRPRAPASKGPMQSLMAGGKHYIRRGDGKEQLFDLSNDPLEYIDLADSAWSASELVRFRRALLKFHPDLAPVLAPVDGNRATAPNRQTRQ